MNFSFPNKKLTLVFLFLLATPFFNAAIPQTVPKTIFVDAVDGSDAYSGFTTSSAFQTIQRALDVATPGSKIYIRRGIYHESLTLKRSGTEENPILMTAYSDESVTIDSTDAIALSTIGEVNYWIIENLTFISTDRYTLRLGWWDDSTTNHWVVENNQIFGANFINGSYHLWENNNIDGTGYTSDWGDAGIMDTGASHHNIYRGNRIHDFTHHNARGIWSQGYTHDNLIENNTVYNILASTGLGQGIDLDGAGKVEWRHTIRGNVIYNCSYTGIQIENAFETVIENNLISQGDAGIIVINYGESIGCGVGGEHQQYGDINGDHSCRGDITDNILQNNIITTTSAWKPGYGGIIIWYTAGVSIQGNHISARYGRNNAGINFQGLPHEIHNSSVLNNIISQGNGAAICATSYISSLTDDNNRFYLTNENGIYANGKECEMRHSLADYQQNTGWAQNSQVITPEFTSLQKWYFCPSITQFLDLIYPKPQFPEQYSSPSRVERNFLSDHD